MQALVRIDDGMTQVEAARLAGAGTRVGCTRRLALLEKLSVAVKEDLRLGLAGTVTGSPVDTVARGQPGSAVGVNASRRRRPRK